jgi:hypothetical protein
MKTTSVNASQVLILAAAGILLLGVSPLRASDTDDRIKSSPKKSYMTIAKIRDKPDETTGEKIDDASITAQVKMSLLSHRSTSPLKTKVETIDGAVTLTGVAKNASEKALVTKLAADVNGVSSVVNKMTFQPAVSKTDSAPLPPQNLRIVTK